MNRLRLSKLRGFGTEAWLCPRYDTRVVAHAVYGGLAVLARQVWSSGCNIVLLATLFQVWRLWHGECWNISGRESGTLVEVDSHFIHGV